MTTAFAEVNCRGSTDCGSGIALPNRNAQPGGKVREVRIATAVSTAPGFDFTARVRALCEHVVDALPEFHHVDLSRVAVSFAQTRKPVMHGLQATLTPLRFEGGATTGIVRGRKYAVQAVYDVAGLEMLYVLNFYLPRFMQLSFTEKLIIIFHELWHISPEFNGDLRRHPGRCYAHSHSQAEYDRQMEVLVEAWLATEPPESLADFLRLDFRQVQQRYGRVYGLKVPRPKLIPRR